MEFIASDPNTIGLELELQLLDADNLELANGIIPLLKFYPDSEYVKPEFIQNTVEIATRVCTSCDELKNHMITLINDVKSHCTELGMTLCGSGTHPFDERLALITPMPRYKHMEEISGYLSHTQITFATHVHIGMQSGDQVIAVMNQLRAYLPLLIAISANSPFWRGYDTGFASYRHRILAATRSFGIPPSFSSWKEFLQFADTTRQADIFSTINDIHWDIRPRPHLGTIEIRVFDAQTTIEDTISLAAFIRTLVIFLRDFSDDAKNPDLPQPLPGWLEKENHFQASRNGLEANYVTNAEGEIQLLIESLHNVVATIRAVSRQLGEEYYLDNCISHIKHGPGYKRQRQKYQETQSMPEVVSDCALKLEFELNQSNEL